MCLPAVLGCSPGAALDMDIPPAPLISTAQRPPEFPLPQREPFGTEGRWAEVETCTGWNLLGNANLIERGGKEKQLRLLLKEAELHHFSWAEQIEG